MVDLTVDSKKDNVSFYYISRKQIGASLYEHDLFKLVMYKSGSGIKIDTARSQVPVPIFLFFYSPNHRAWNLLEASLILSTDYW